MKDPNDRGVDRGRSSAQAPHNVENLIGFLEGTWQFERKVHDMQLDSEVDAIGVAWFKAGEPHNGQDTLDYIEEGGTDLGETELELDREFRYNFTNSALAEVRFTDGRFFHVLDMSKGIVRVDHNCGEDTYSGVFRALNADGWLSVWRIEGPGKSQVVTTRYIRVRPN